MKKRVKKTKDSFRKELDLYAQSGIPLWLEGRPSKPGEIVKAHKLAEESSYMRDYVTDENGKLIRLEFGKVTER